MSNFQHKFLKVYSDALAQKCSTNQLAQYLGIKPNTVKRYISLIRSTMGITLPPLPNQDSGTSLQETNNYRQIDDFKGTQKTYIITAAQNATPIHDKFLRSLEVYAKRFDATLHVIAYRYKNPTSLWTDNNEKEEWWDKRVVPYLLNDDIVVSPNLKIVGSVKIQPTATCPLSGFDSYTGQMSAVFGHPKIQLKTIPTPSQQLPKILTTTGAVTIENYTDTKAGKKGEFHHTLAATIIEVDNDGTTHIRHVHADDSGSFYDLHSLYTPSGYTTGHRSAALIMGDAHIEFMDPFVENATFSNINSMVKTLKPEHIVYHDAEDFYRRNHHHKGNHLLAYAKHHLGRNNVEAGLQLVADFIDAHTYRDTTNIVVKSNHDEALSRWLLEADPKTDPENARFYHYLMYHTLSNYKITPTGYKSIDPFIFWCQNPMAERGMKNESTVFLSRDESFIIHGIELGFHGDKGPNGGRGSIKSFTKIGPKMVIGHSHTPGIEEGVYQVGVSARLDLEYVSGPSSWLQTHCVIYPNGKRSLLNIINGKWKLNR